MFLIFDNIIQDLKEEKKSCKGRVIASLEVHKTTNLMPLVCVLAFVWFFFSSPSFLSELKQCVKERAPPNEHPSNGLLQ